MILMEDEKVRGRHTPGPWLIATSNSWRRIVSRDHGPVAVPVVTWHDNHPDLEFPNGGEDGPDARMLVAAPELLHELKLALEWIGNLATTMSRKQLLDLMPNNFGGQVSMRALIDKVEGRA